MIPADRPRPWVGSTGQSALIVEVPEAELAVQRHRDRLDANARLGVPAHFTVLFPFMPAADLAPAILDHLEGLLASKTAFSLDLARTAWFGEQVLWIAPEDPQPLRDLTDLVHRAYPSFPPYQGEHEDPVPHLTVAHGCELTQMQAAERELRNCLPIHAHVKEVTLLTQTGDTGTWEPLTRFALAHPPTT